jgi:Domain of unknown function (DUF5004)
MIILKIPNQNFNDSKYQLRSTKASVIMLFFVFTALIFSGCKKGDDPNPSAEKFKQLSGVWHLGTITNNGLDVTPQYDGFTLTINTDKTFSTTNGNNPWPASGTLEFTSTDLDQWLRNDGAEITIQNATESTLVLSMTQNSIANGRISGVTGQFVFSLIK